MKKIISLALVAILLGCSSNSSSDSNSSTTEFMRISIDGTEYYEELNAYYYVQDTPNCSNNGVLNSLEIDQVETSNFFVEVDLSHFSNVIDFDNSQKNNISSTRLRDDNSTWSVLFSNTCDLSNDLTIIYQRKPSNQRLYLKPNSNPTHKITKVALVSQDAEVKTYKIEGNFNAIFNRSGVDLPIHGNYRVLVDILK